MRAIQRNAFTLVEMLVVIVLLTMLIATAVFAYKNMIIHVKQTKRENFNTLYSYHYLRSSISAMNYYVVESEKRFGFQETLESDFYYFFKGTTDQCTYISKSPLFSEAISVISLRCEENELRYYESLLYGPQDYKDPHILDNAKTKVLYRDLSSCQFLYTTKESTHAELHNKIPLGIQINIQKNEIAHEYYFKIKSNRIKTNIWISSEIFDEE